MTDLGSAPFPPPAPDDHVRGPRDAPLIVVYGEFECPFCAVVHERLGRARLRVLFRHFPVSRRHPRALAAARAAEAAGLQGAFWPMHDALFADQGRLEDPHLWRRAGDLGLDVDRFDSDRRSTAVIERVERDFRAGVRAGVVTTPTLVLGEEVHSGSAAVAFLNRFSG